MRFRPPLLFVFSFAFVACQTTHDVAVSTWRVVDAPARYIRRKIDPERTTTTQTQTTTVYSDTGPAGRPVAAPTPRRSATPRRQVTSSEKITPRPQPTPYSEQTAKPVPTPHVAATAAASAQQDFPVAKTVPGKPGFVYSPFDSSGAMIDVTGYQPGTKVKDPETKKIFVVP